MQNRELREALEDLHRELKALKSVDKRSRSLLADLSEDIDRVLSHRGEAPSEPHTDLLDRLRASTSHLGVSHPDLTSLMQRAIDTLANMGI